MAGVSLCQSFFAKEKNSEILCSWDDLIKKEVNAKYSAKIMLYSC